MRKSYVRKQKQQSYVKVLKVAKMSSCLLKNRISSLRFVQKRFSSLLSSPKQEELRIPVPWGHIAGKTWGNPQGIPVICLHGWLDNAGSFDKLAPLLPNDSHKFIAIELPGHGFSSHFPEGMSYRFSDTFTVLKYTKEFMNIQKFAIIGHSLGAAVGVWYSAIFPEDVDRLISIDLVNVGPVTLDKHAKKSKESVLSGIKTFKKLSAQGQEEPTYEYIDAVARAFMANQYAHGNDSITQESVETLMKRGLKPTSDGTYTWSADLRLRVPAAFSALEEQVLHYASRIQCPMLLLKGTESHYYMQEEVAKRIIKAYINHNPNFQLAKIQGGHHVHMDHPDRVIFQINDFLFRAHSYWNEETLEKQENFPLDLF